MRCLLSPPQAWPGLTTGLHSEVFNHQRGVALGVNIEMSNDYSGSEQTVVTGLNIQAVGGSAPMQHGIQIHDGNNHFQTAIHLPGKGAAGIDLPGSFQVGLNLHDNHLRLNEGACIELDGKGQVKLRYNNNRIEFLNGDRCFAHLDVNGRRPRDLAARSCPHPAHSGILIVFMVLSWKYLFTCSGPTPQPLALWLGGPAGNPVKGSLLSWRLLSANAGELLAGGHVEDALRADGAL